MTDHGTVERLRAAALRLAAEHPDRELTVGSIVGEAGVNREDFHRNASTPVQLLAEALGDELLTQYDALDAGLPDADPEMRPRLALEHISRWMAVYGGPIRGELMAALRKTLFPPFRMINEEHLRRHPERLPQGISPDDDAAIEFLAAYVAGGGMAAIERWVEDPEPDVERGLALLLAAAPRFLH